MSDWESQSVINLTEQQPYPGAREVKYLLIFLDFPNIVYTKYEIFKFLKIFLSEGWVFLIFLNMFLSKIKNF